MPPRANSLPEPEVSIIGAGPAGLTLALALADAGIRVAVVDKGEKPSDALQDYDGRAYSFAHGCWKIWEALGVGAALSEHAQPLRKVTAEAAGGRPIIFSQDDLDTESAPLGYMVEARHLNHMLRRAAEKSSLISILYETSVFGVETSANQAKITLTGHETPLPSRLIIGCDGRNSTIRQLCGIRWFGHDYNSASVVATVKLERDHDGAARQTFLKSGPFAALPLQNNRANLVWTEDREVAETLCAMSDEAFEAELADRLGAFLGDFKLDGPRFSYPLTMRVAEHFHTERVALVGDAAHAIHPLAGQGLNLGLKDVAVLAEALVEADRVGLDLGAPLALESYDAARRPDVMSMAFGMDGFEKLFSTPSPIRALAGAGMSMVGDIAPARKFFAQHASGATRQPPRLMRGESFS